MFGDALKALVDGRRVSLTKIDSAVAAWLGPTRVHGNAQPAASNRQIAMYLANLVGGWSTTRIGNFYTGHDPSTVCYAIHRVEGQCSADPRLDGLLTMLENQLTADPGQVGSGPAEHVSSNRRQLVSDKFLRALADQLWERIAAAPRAFIMRTERVQQARPGETAVWYPDDLGVLKGTILVGRVHEASGGRDTRRRLPMGQPHVLHADQDRHLRRLGARAAWRL